MINPMKAKNAMSLSLALMMGNSPLHGEDTKIHPDLLNALSKVDSDGSYLELNSVSEDMEVLTKYSSILMEVIGEMDETVPKVDTRQLMDALGILDLKSLARSNKKHGDLWINKTYLANGGSGKGLFSLMGGKGDPFTVPSMSPDGTDIAMEIQLSFEQLPELIKSIARPMGAGEEAEKELKKQVLPLQMSIGETLSRLYTKLHFAIDFDLEGKADPGKMMTPDFVGRVDHLTWLWLKVGDEFLKENLVNLGMEFQRKEDGSTMTYTLTPVQQSPGLGDYKPLIVVDTKNDMIWVASSAGFLEKAMKQGGNLSDSSEFKMAWEGMPQNGNAMAYLSKDLIAGLGEIAPMMLTHGAGTDEDTVEFMTGIQKMITQFVQDMSKSGLGVTFSVTRDEGGFYTASKLPFPEKYFDLVSQQLTTMLPLYLGISTPMETPLTTAASKEIAKVEVEVKQISEDAEKAIADLEKKAGESKDPAARQHLEEALKSLRDSMKLLNEPGTPAIQPEEIIKSAAEINERHFKSMLASSAKSQKAALEKTFKARIEAAETPEQRQALISKYEKLLKDFDAQMEAKPAEGAAKLPVER
jgi:hypothetical protein